MAEAEKFDVLVLGSGAGGKLLAWHLGASGKKVAVVERKWIGGSCPNIACLPSKNFIWSAEVAHLSRNSSKFGTVAGGVAVDMKSVRERKREMVKRLVDIHLQKYKASGAELVMGTGAFVAPKTIEVQLNDGGKRLLTGDQVFIDTGSRAAIQNVPGLEAARPLTHIEILEIDYVPAKLVVLGGGYVGLEMAQAFHRFGSSVTVIERGPQIMSKEDGDVSEEMYKILSDEGIHFKLNAEIVKVEGQSGKNVTIVVRTKSGEERVEATDILASSGRVPNTQGIGLDKAGVQVDERGFIRVNDRLETTAPEVWAVGDCAGSPQFTHISENDFIIIRNNLEGGNSSTRTRQVPYCLFTDPQLSHVGLSENDAQRQGIKVRVAKMPTGAVLRTQTNEQRLGFMKAVVSADDDRILGFTMIGADAGELVAVVQIAMLGNLPYQQLRDAVLTHPTMAEGLGPLFANVPAR